MVTFENVGGNDNDFEETAYRLISILRKLINPDESVERFTRVKKPNADTIKEIIFEISSRCDELLMRSRGPRRDNFMMQSH